MDSVGWVMYSASAAAVMVPCCTTAQKVSMSRFVMAFLLKYIKSRLYFTRTTSILQADIFVI